MNKIKQALHQARHDGILRKSSVVDLASDEELNQAQERVRKVVAPKIDVPEVELKREKLRSNLVFRGEEVNQYAMAYKMLRTQVMQKMAANGWSTLGITSSRAGEGKSLTALNLSFSLAKASTKPVLLVDLDLRKPTLKDKLGLASERGMADYFTAQTPLRELLVQLSDGLTLIPGVGSLTNSSELMASLRMKQLLQELQDFFPGSLIVFDLPPVLVVDDVLALSPMLDACLVIAEEGRTKRDDLKQTIELLKLTNLMGIVLNKSGETTKSHYYDNY